MSRFCGATPRASGAWQVVRTDTCAARFMRQPVPHRPLSGAPQTICRGDQSPDHDTRVVHSESKSSAFQLAFIANPDRLIHAVGSDPARQPLPVALITSTALPSANSAVTLPFSSRWSPTLQIQKRCQRGSSRCSRAKTANFARATALLFHSGFKTGFIDF